MLCKGGNQLVSYLSHSLVHVGCSDPPLVDAFSYISAGGWF